MPESTEPRTTRAERDELRQAWNRRGHDGWLTACSGTWGRPGNQRLRVYLALILRGPGQVDWGNPDWPLLEEQRLFYEPAGTEPEDEARMPDITGDDYYRSNPWTDGLAGGICGLALALGAALSLGWIHL